MMIYPITPHKGAPVFTFSNWNIKFVPYLTIYDCYFSKYLLKRIHFCSSVLYRWSEILHTSVWKCEKGCAFMAGGVLHGGTRKSAYLFYGIRKNCIYLGGFWKTGTLSHTEIWNFGGWNTAKVSILVTLMLLKRKWNSISRTQ